MRHRLAVFVAAMAVAVTALSTDVAAAVPSHAAETSVDTATGRTVSVTCTVTADCSWEQWVRAIEGTLALIDDLCGDAGGSAQLRCVGDYVVGPLDCADDIM